MSQRTVKIDGQEYEEITYPRGHVIRTLKGSAAAYDPPPDELSELRAKIDAIYEKVFEGK